MAENLVVMQLPSQFQNLAAGGTSMVTKLTGGLTDFIAHGIPGLAEDHFQEPSFEALQKTFGLANSDSLIGCFVCELKQRYRSIDNALSPDIQVDNAESQADWNPVCFLGFISGDGECH